MTDTSETRSIEVELDIDAAVARVWKALTDPEELSRWFPLMADVQPGVGGSIRLSWGTGLEGRNAVLAWEANRHLKTRWFEGGPDTEASTTRDGSPRDREAWGRLAVDFYLEDKGDRTLVRMVHSGFSRDASWDDEYEAHARGWTFELRSLTTYLEHHHGQARHVAWVRRPIAVSKAEAWSRLVSDSGMLREGSLEGTKPGGRYAITAAHGDRFEGRVILHRPPTEFAGTVDNLNLALLRFGIENYGQGPEATIWLSTWGEPDPSAAYRERWTHMFDELFG